MAENLELDDWALDEEEVLEESNATGGPYSFYAPRRVSGVYKVIARSTGRRTTRTTKTPTWLGSSPWLFAT